MLHENNGLMVATPIETDSDILIVGGGPVGLGLAIEVGQRGHRCIVVEKHEIPSPIPRGQNLTQRTLEHFHFWGAEKQLRAARTIPPEYGIGGVTVYGSLLGEFSYDWLPREFVRPFYFTDNERLPQYATEAVLRERAAHLPAVEVIYGLEAETVAQDDHSVSVVAKDRNSGAERRLTGRYLVGCDGSKSIVRTQAGISETRSDHDRLMVLLVFKSEQLHDLLERYPGKSFYNVLNPDLQGYWRFFGRVDLGSGWFFHAPVPADTTRDNFDFEALLHEAVGTRFELEFEHIGFWELRIAIADSYRQDRIFIAGDAAHSHPPYGAFGINTGFEDARNLGWKLAGVLEGWADEAILETYGEERRPVFVSTARDFIESVIEKDRGFLRDFDPARDRAAFERAWSLRASGTSGEVDAFEPNYRGSSIVAGEEGAVSDAKGPHSFAARPGHHLAPQSLSSGKNVYEELGDGLTLLALDAGPAVVGAFETAGRQLGVPFHIIADNLAGGRENYQARLILVRPDQFVAWCGDDLPQDAERIVARAIGRFTA